MILAGLGRIDSELELAELAARLCETRPTSREAEAALRRHRRGAQQRSALGQPYFPELLAATAHPIRLIAEHSDGTLEEVYVEVRTGGVELRDTLGGEPLLVAPDWGSVKERIGGMVTFYYPV